MTIRVPRNTISPWWLLLAAIPAVILWFAAAVALRMGVDI